MRIPDQIDSNLYHIKTIRLVGTYEKICSIAFVTSRTDALEPCAALPSLTQLATVFHMPASLKAFQLSPSTRIIIVDFFDGQAMSPECH
jgi:hypothetical protein